MGQLPLLKGTAKRVRDLLDVGELGAPASGGLVRDRWGKKRKKYGIDVQDVDIRWRN